MDIWKILILALVLAGVALVFSGPPEPPKLPEGARVEEGTFRVTTSRGSWEEIFGVYPADVGFRVVSIAHREGEVLFEAELLYDRDWLPLAGTITRRVPEEARHLYAFSGTEVSVRIQRGSREKAATFSVPEGSLLWEPEVLASWYALLRAAPKERVLSTFSCLEGRTWQGEIEAGQEVQLRTLGREIPATLRHLRLDGEVYEIFQQGELLLGAQGEGFSAYLVEVLPEGVQR